MEGEQYLYEVEISFDPKSIVVYMPSSRDSLDLKIKLNYKEELLLPDIMDHIKEIYYRINPLSYSSTTYTTDPVCF